MRQSRPTYRELEQRLVAAEPIVQAMKDHEVDAVVGREKIAFLLVREAGDALQKRDAEFRAMFELSGVGMFQADAPAFRFTRVNERFCEILGYGATELLGKSYVELTDPQDRQRDLVGIAPVIRGTARGWSVEKRVVRKDGGVIWVAVHGAAVKDATGRAVRFMAMVSDITAYKEAEEALGERSRQLRKLGDEVGLAQERERRRIALALHGHIEALLLGTKRPATKARREAGKTVRQALKDVQDFIDQELAPADGRRSETQGGKVKAARRGGAKKRPRGGAK